MEHSFLFRMWDYDHGCVSAYPIQRLAQKIMILMCFACNDFQGATNMNIFVIKLVPFYLKMVAQHLFLNMKRSPFVQEM